MPEGPSGENRVLPQTIEALERANGIANSKQGTLMRDLARVCGAGNASFHPAVSGLSSLQSSAVSRLTSLYSPIKSPKCDYHYHHPEFAHIFHGRDPSFALTTSTAVFSRHGVLPRSAWATHSAELYRQPGRPHQEGRSTRTPPATSGTWNHRATVLASRVRRTGRKGKTSTCRWVWKSRCTMFHPPIC